MSKQTDLINIPDAITVSGSNVGIGTTSPSSNYGFSKTVEIQGGVNSELSLSQTNNSKDWSFGVGNGNCYQQTNSGQNYSWYTGGVEKLRIQSGGGISFNGDTAAANALNDYEEGTFTPAISGLTFTTAAGLYVKVGRACHVTINMEGANTSKTGDIYISGLPFNAITNSSLMPVNSVPIMEVANVNLTGSYINMYGRINSADNRLQLLQSSGVSHASMAAGGGISAGGVLRTSFTYQTA